MDTEETKWQNELEQLQAIINKTILVSTTKWGSEVFTHQGKNILSYGAFKNYFALWFYNGVFLKDPYQVLVNAQEGVTKALRQWRFASAAEIDERKILEYIAEAIQNEEEGKSWKPEKNPMPDIPPILQSALNEDTAFKIAFSKFSPYKQREFIEYLDTAKREATKLARLEKIKPLILSGIGLHDKYK